MSELTNVTPSTPRGKSTDTGYAPTDPALPTGSDTPLSLGSIAATTVKSNSSVPKDQSNENDPPGSPSGSRASCVPQSPHMDQHRSSTRRYPPQQQQRYPPPPGPGQTPQQYFIQREQQLFAQWRDLMQRRQYYMEHGVIPSPGVLSPSPLQPPSYKGCSPSSFSSTDEMQHGQMTASSQKSHEAHTDSATLQQPPNNNNNYTDSTGQQQPSRHSPSLPPSQPSPQEVWVTIQNYSMFLNTIPRRPLTRSYTQRPPCTRRFFTLCSLAEYISQFDLTDPDAAEKAETDEEYILYQDAYSSFPSPTLTTTMTLYFLYHAPQIYLPLAPFHDAIYSAIGFAYTFELAHWQYRTSFNVICRMVTGILTMRIRHAVNHLYPHLKVNSLGGSIPEVEHDKPPILEWLARDMLAAFNPIEIMLMYYRPIITAFNQIPNPTLEDRQLCFKKVQKISGWLHEMRSICMMYGLHIHDSLWVSMDEWEELADYMDTISTKIAPDLFDVVQGKHPVPTSDEERREIVFTTSWYETFLCFLAPCFTHHYRPMRKPSNYNVPFGNWPVSSTMYCYLPPAAYADMTENLPIALEQYATMYVEDPQQFECEGSQAVSQQASQTHHDNNGNNLKTITPSSIRPAFDDIINNTSPTLEKEVYTYTKDYQQLGLELSIYSYTFSRIQHLLRAIKKYPPANDPVYELFAPWFTYVNKDMRIMTRDRWTKLENPVFTYRRRP